MDKFFRTYTIDFYIGKVVSSGFTRKITYTDTVSVTYPLTAQFSIGRSVSSYQNTANITLYGLDESKRNLIYKDSNDMTRYIKMVVNAGYTEATSTIYVGAIDECFSVRNGGETEYRTVISATDSTIDLFSSQASKSFSAETDVAAIINSLGGELAELQIGTISPNIDFPTNKRAAIFDGKVLDILENLKEGTMVVDNGYVNFVNQETDVLKKYGILEVSCDTGMIGTPRRRGDYYTVELIFEPNAALCQLCELKSTTAPHLNQQYKIMGLAHDGIISGSKGGSMITRLELFAGTGKFHYI